MEQFDVYKDIRERTDGDVYIGVVGPVRAGKSTFITNFMNKLVIPKIKSKHARERMQDELPQSANGKAIMTTQPKFVPGEAVTVSFGDKMDARIRLVDCVGYLIDGATGYAEDGKPRMVRTPWSDEPVPFAQAAETGTRKVISEHSTIGIVMTSDGSIDTEIARSAYVPAEERVVGELSELGKPFVVVLNSKVPDSTETEKLAASLTDKYGTAVIPMDVLNMGEKEIAGLLGKVLLEFPLRDVEISMDKWLQALPADNEIISSLTSLITEKTAEMVKMSDCYKMQSALDGDKRFAGISLDKIDAGTGRLCYTVSAAPELFYEALSAACGSEIKDDFALMSKIAALSKSAAEYDKIGAAMEQVKKTGYGVVTPAQGDMTLSEPEIVRQGSRYAVRLRATAPSLHIMEVDVAAEVNPVIGEAQSEESLRSLLSGFESDPKGIWDTQMLGKSMHELAEDKLRGKIASVPDDTQKKMRKTLTRIVNEGKGGVICILL